MDDSSKQALLAWVNGCPLDHEVTSIQDLADCVILRQLVAFFVQGVAIGEADEETLAGTLSVGSAEWQAAISERRRKVIQLLNDGHPEPLVHDNLEPGEAGDWLLLEAVLLAAVEGPCREDAIHNVMCLAPEDQAVIAALLQSRIASDASGPEGDPADDRAAESSDRGNSAEKEEASVDSAHAAAFDPPPRTDRGNSDTDSLESGRRSSKDTSGGDDEIDRAATKVTKVGFPRRNSATLALLQRAKATVDQHGDVLGKDGPGLASVAIAATDKKQNDLETIVEMRSQLRDLRSEFQGMTRESDAVRQATRQATLSIREAREKAWYEEDIAHQRIEQLAEFEDECRCLDDRVDLLREEIRQDSAGSHNDATADLQQRLHEQTRKCAALRAKRDDLQARLVNAELGTERMEKQNWRRVALRSKITRLEEKREEKDKRLLNLKGLQFQEEKVAAKLRGELEEANQCLTKQDRGMKEIKYLYTRCEEGQENAQSRLEIYAEELRVLKRGDLDAMNEELTLRRQMAAQLEQNCGDTHSRSMFVQAQIPLLEELAVQANGQLEENAGGRRKSSVLVTGDPEMEIERAKCKRIGVELREAKNAVHNQEEQAKKIEFQLGDIGRRLREAEAKAELEIEKMNRADKKAAKQKAERREDGSDLPVPSGPMVAKLREQLLLRERELRFRESNAGEVQRYHDREMALLSSALHQLAIKYGKLLTEVEGAEKDEQNFLDDLEEEALEEARAANS